eukprot:COSAG02_NODE_1387_length_12938_cov_24.292235_6_plen_1592_part_00
MLEWEVRTDAGLRLLKADWQRSATMKRIRRMSVNLGLKKVEKRVDPSDGVAYTEEEFEEVYGPGCEEWESASPVPVESAPTSQGNGASERPQSSEEFAAAPGASVMPEFLMQAQSWKAPALSEPDVEPAPSGFKGKLRRMSVTMLSPLGRDDAAEKYAVQQDKPTVVGLPQSQVDALASQSSPSPKKKGGLLGRARRASVTLLSLGGDSAPESQQEGMQAVLEAEKVSLQEAEEEERKYRLMLEQQRIERERIERMKSAEKATEEAEYRNQEIIRLRREKLAEEEALAEREENLRRIRASKEREQKEKAQRRIEEQKARMMGNRDQRRQAAWKLYQEQMQQASKGADGSGNPAGVAQGADLLWRIVAPGATVCSMEASKAEIMDQVNGLAPVKTVNGKLHRNKLVVVGIGGPVGAGKTVLARRLKADCDALVLPLNQFSKAGEHPSQLNADQVCKAVLDMRATFRAELPMDIERDLEAEANMESIRRKLYAASYGNGGQDWHKLFQGVDKDKSGELGFQEFRTAVRKGAKLSPIVVSDDALKTLFKAVDTDRSGEINAQEFANFLNTKNRGAEDEFGTKRTRVIDCPPSKLLVLEGSNVFHPSLVRHLDVQVFVTGPPQLHIARAMAREIQETKLHPHRILGSIAGSRGPVQALHANKAASRAHILVRNQWSPVISGEGQPDSIDDSTARAVSRSGSQTASRSSTRDKARASIEVSQLETCGGPVHSMLIERGESLEDWSHLVDWVRGSVRQSGGVCVSHGRHTTIHSAFPLIGDETGNALRGLQGKTARANDGDGESDEEVDRANAKERLTTEPPTAFRGVQLDSLPPWPDDPTDPLPPILKFTRAVLLPPRDPLDDGSDNAQFTHAKPRRWVTMQDMGGSFTYSFCEREVKRAFTPNEDGTKDDSLQKDQQGATKTTGHRRKNGQAPSVAKVDSSWAWPILGESSSVTSFLGLGYTLTNLEEVQAHVFVVPTSHLQHSHKPRPLLPFAAKAKQVIKEKEASARRERRKREKEIFKEEQQHLPVWKRKQRMETSTQSFGDTQETLNQTMSTLEGAQVTQSVDEQASTTKSFADEAGDEETPPGDSKKKRHRRKKQQSMKERVAAKKSKALAKENEERLKSKTDRSVMIIVERVLIQGDNAAGTIPKVHVRVEGGDKKDVEVVSRIMVLGTMMCGTRGKTKVSANRDGVMRGPGEQFMTAGSILPYINPWRPPSATPTNSSVSSAAPGRSIVAGALPALGGVAVPGSAHAHSREGRQVSSRASSRGESHNSDGRRTLPKAPRRIRSDPKFMREEAIRREKLRAERKLAQKRAKELEIERQKLAELETVNSLAKQGGRWSISRPCYEGLLTMDITQPSDSDSAEEDDFDDIAHTKSADGGVSRGKSSGEVVEFEENINRSAIERNAMGCEEPHSDDPELWNIDGTECDIRAKYKVGGQMWYLQSRALDAIKNERPIAGSPMNRTAVLSHRKYKVDEAATVAADKSAATAQCKEDPLGEGQDEAQQKNKLKSEKINRSAIERNAKGCEEPHSDDPELWNIDGTECDIRAKYKVGGQMWYLQSRALDAIKNERPIAGSPMNRAAVAAERRFNAD